MRIAEKFRASGPGLSNCLFFLFTDDECITARARARAKSALLDLGRAPNFAMSTNTRLGNGVIKKLIIARARAREMLFTSAARALDIRPEEFMGRRKKTAARQIVNYPRYAEKLFA